MFSIDLNTKVISTAASMLRDIVTTQSRERTKLVDELNKICADCDLAYDALIVRLTSLRNIHATPEQLAHELREFSDDMQIRAKFKPDGLCVSIDKLIITMKDNLQTLKYSVNLFALDDIQAHLRQLGNYDSQMYHQYDRFRNQLRQIADQIFKANDEERFALVALARSTIKDVCDDLLQAVAKIRQIKVEIVAIA